MLTWYQEQIIQAPIDKVWSLFELENLTKIMPNVVSTTVIEEKPDVIGSTYLQKYREGKKIMEYVVTDIAHENHADYKMNRSHFQIGGMIDIEVQYELRAINEQETQFIYSGQNKGVTLIGKLLLKLMPKKQNQKVVDEFMQRVKAVAEGES